MVGKRLLGCVLATVVVPQLLLRSLQQGPTQAQRGNNSNSGQYNNLRGSSRSFGSGNQNWGSRQQPFVFPSTVKIMLTILSFSVTKVSLTAIQDKAIKVYSKLPKLPASSARTAAATSTPSSAAASPNYGRAYPPAKRVRFSTTWQ